jgi:ribosome-binding protein aMBF1 (putative translation factor)
MNDEIGLAIRLGRVAVGLSQWQLAQKLGVHPVVINSIERGKRVPDAGLVRSMLDAIEASATGSRLVGVVLREAERAARNAGRQAK